MQPDDLEKKIDLYGPLAQAERCLDRWLAAERLSLGEAEKSRTAALMARYFMHEDQVTDALMLSFLQHYSKRMRGAPQIDLEDPVSVRMEIKTLLDGATHRPKRFPLALTVGVSIVMAIALAVWVHGRQPITDAQQALLKSLVHDIAAADPKTTSAAVWKKIKEPLHVRSYQDIRQSDFDGARAQLEQLLQAAKNSAGPGVSPVVNGK